MNKKNILILLGIFIIIIMVILIMYFLKKDSINNNNNTNKNIVNYDCVKKDNLCNDYDIAFGLSYTYAVNDDESVEFYVIGNTKETLTLLAKKSVVNDSDWYTQYSNAFGPADVLNSLYEVTSKWDNVKIINNYSYKDSGYDYYDKKCISKTDEDKSYMCAQSSEIVYGYDNFSIKDGKGIITSASGTSYELEYTSINSRLITKEEIEYLLKNSGNNKLEWLIPENPHWTLTSATEKDSDYFLKAYGVWRDRNDIKLYPYLILDDSSPVGIHPVIIVDKY